SEVARRNGAADRQPSAQDLGHRARGGPARRGARRGNADRRIQGGAGMHSQDLGKPLGSNQESRFRGDADAGRAPQTNELPGPPPTQAGAAAGRARPRGGGARGAGGRGSGGRGGLSRRAGWGAARGGGGVSPTERPRDPLVWPASPRRSSSGASSRKAYGFA